MALDDYSTSGWRGFLEQINPVEVFQPGGMGKKFKRASRAGQYFMGTGDESTPPTDPSDKPLTNLQKRLQKLENDPHYGMPGWTEDPNNQGVMTEAWRVPGTPEYNQKQGETLSRKTAEALEKYGFSATPKAEITDIAEYEKGKGAGATEQYRLLAQKLLSGAETRRGKTESMARQAIAKRGIEGGSGVEESVVGDISAESLKEQQNIEKDVELAKIADLRAGMERENEKIFTANLGNARTQLEATLQAIYGDEAKAKAIANKEYNTQMSVWSQARAGIADREAREYDKYMADLAKYEEAEMLPYELAGAALPVAGTVIGSALGSPWLGSAIGAGAQAGLRKRPTAPQGYEYY